MVVPCRIIALALLPSSLGCGNEPLFGPAHADVRSVRFDGYMANNPTDTLCAVAMIGNDGKVLAQGWYGIGRTVLGTKLLSFDKETETIFVKLPSGDERRVPLVSASIKHAKSEPANRDEARAWSFARIDRYRQSAQRRFGSAEVEYFDDASIPESKRKSVEDNRAKAVTLNSTYFPTKVNGKWVHVFIPDSARVAEIPANVDRLLTETDRDEIKAAWLAARVEVGARAIAGSLNRPSDKK